MCWFKLFKLIVKVLDSECVLVENLLLMLLVGELLFIIGVSGCGKSLLLCVIVGLWI